ncbi:PqiA family protein [Shewanella colwelliana]|uniref:Paraquat-inducible protein A n=1 Tax=Shewanella colwelliana TaxID=23 RepID=A0A1E5IZB3_SHECO|nr:paraquat-inducible protein A [Shewanella colwelliana]MDX1282086.1 paraquat-inducible protein A [Shewanella colwelliana]OEG75875.1 paraquat-inducible protein A [Shewanella colwelliana]GIU24247.1 PqiA family protein [Shewanella colwelliana]GIU41428.1 PqiA family protein [Shewanella colwelliana]
MDKDELDKSIVLCRACDLAVRKRALPTGVRALCPRCHTNLYDTPYCSINGMLALCLTALFLYFPANFYPVLELHFLGSVRTTTIIEGAMSVADQGYWIVGIAVLTAAVIAPGLLIASVLAQILIVKYQLNNPFFRDIYKRLLRYHGLLSQLTMLEIYMISIFVSVFQLSDYTDLYFGIGTFCFSVLFVMVIFLQREYDIEHMWSVLDEQ